jgi:hypothetical protein
MIKYTVLDSKVVVGVFWHKIYRDWFYALLKKKFPHYPYKKAEEEVKAG